MPQVVENRHNRLNETETMEAGWVRPRQVRYQAALRPLLTAGVNSTVVADENLTVGSTVRLPAESLAPGR